MRELDIYLNFCRGDINPVSDRSNKEEKDQMHADPSFTPQIMDGLEEIKTLDQLRSAMESVETSLKEGCANLVFSDGVEESKIMLIGEAPGKDEDLKGKPFVGQSGQLLDKILASIGLSRMHQAGNLTVYITNVVPWRPPQNRPPTRKEIDQFLPYLIKHIAIISPEILVLWGATALKALFPDDGGILRERGKWKQIYIGGKCIPTIATFHPAFLLRQASRKREVWEDMKSLRSRIEALSQ